MGELTQAIKNVRSVGGMGLDYLGMPPSAGEGNGGSKDPYLFHTFWSKPTGNHDDDDEWGIDNTIASLKAELFVLETMGLIQVVDVAPPPQNDWKRGFLLEAHWRYTDAGAKAVAEEWRRVHGEYPSSHEGSDA